MTEQTVAQLLMQCQQLKEDTLSTIRRLEQENSDLRAAATAEAAHADDTERQNQSLRAAAQVDFHNTQRLWCENRLLREMLCQSEQKREKAEKYLETIISG